jgi:hypothetical protein
MKLVTGRIGKVPSANVSADRYQFIQLSETEPDLGLPSQLGQVFTSDLSGNRYWSRLDTANVSENGNLYFTDDRVTANVANLSVGTLFDVILGSNLSTGKALVYDGNVNAFVPVFVNSEVANVADLAVKVLSLENQTTANVREASSNLYFTNTRVLDAISLSDINPYNVTANGNLIVIGNTTLQQANVGSVYFNSGENLLPYNSEGGPSNFALNVKDGLTISDLIQGTQWYIGGVNANNYDIVAAGASNIRLNAGYLSASKLYTTDAVLDELTANNVSLLNANIDVLNATHVDFDHVTIRTNLTVYGDVTTYGANNVVLSDNMLYINHGTNVALNPDLGIAWAFDPTGTDYQHGGIFRDADDGVIKFFEGYLEEPDANIFLDTNSVVSGFALANIAASALIGNVVGVVSSLDNHTTDSLNEGTANLYYTDARVIVAVNPLLTTANVVELDNLYYTDARVLSNVEQMSINVLADVDITDISVSATLVWDGTKFVPGSTESALRSNFANASGSSNVSLLADYANVSLLADYANLVYSLENHTTANLIEGGNSLYFTNVRARMAFTPGKGIAILENGTIKNTGAPDIYSLNLDGTVYGNVSGSLSNALVFPSSTASDRYLLRSLLVTNLHDNTVLLSGNILFGTGNTAVFANQMPLHEGSATEFIVSKPQIFNPGDQIKLQGFDSAGTPTSDIMNYVMTYETLDNAVDYTGTGVTIPTPDTTVQVYHSETAYSIFESIKLVNVTTEPVKVKLSWADGNNNPLAYYVYNFPVPQHSSVEILQNPKRINTADKLFVSYTGTASNDALSVFLCSRLSGVYTLGVQTTSSDPGGPVLTSFSSTESDGTTLYYTIETP